MSSYESSLEAINSVQSNVDMNLIGKYQSEFENFSYGPQTMMHKSNSKSESSGNRTSYNRDSEFSVDLSIPEENTNELDPR